MEEGITTISFYKGQFEPASEALRTQFARVVTFNPWLAGRLVKTKAGVRLQHPVDPVSEQVDLLFKATSSEADTGFKVSATRPYVELTDGMYKSKKVVVESGSATLAKNKPLTLLTVAHSDPGEFALIFSLSHVIGDGRTYYEILKMLQPGAEVRELTSTRVMSFSESMRDMCNRKALAWADKPGTQIMYTVAMMGNKKASCYAFHLDDEKVAAEKTAWSATGEVPYVTTNDILTSRFFNECQARIGMMGFDCRGKLEGMDNDLAGNYVTALVLDNEVFSTPTTLRKMYSNTPYETTQRPLPGCCACCCGGNARFAMVSNWSSFAGGLVALEGCEMVIHLPVLNTSYISWDQMIPFASGVGKKGVICWTVSTDEAGLREALPVGELVSKDLFP